MATTSKGLKSVFFEENGIEDTPQTPVGQSKFIDDVHIFTKKTPIHISLLDVKVSARLWCFSTGVPIFLWKEFVDIYLDKAPRDTSTQTLDLAVIRDTMTMVAMHQLLKKALDKITVGTNYKAKELHDVPIGTFVQSTLIITFQLSCGRQ